MATLAACARNKGSGFYGYALVACAGDNSLAVVDLTAFRVTSTIPLGASPNLVLAAPANRAYALTPLNGTVHLVDSSLRRVISKRIADHVAQIALMDEGKSLMALDSASQQLIQLDPVTLAPRSRHKLSVQPDSMDFSATGSVAVANSAGAVELLNLISGQRSRAQTPKLGAIRFRADGKVLLAANVQNRSLLALDVPTLETIAELPLAMQPDNLCFNPDQGQLFISGAGMDGVAVVFPYNTLEVDQTLLAGRAPGAMACSANPPFLFVGSSVGPDVCVLNIDTRKVIAFVETGSRPSFIRVTPDSSYVLAFDQAAGDMGVIRVPAIRVTADARRLKNGAALFTMLSVGTRPVDAAIVQRAV